jgi:hypothetical protein
MTKKTREEVAKEIRFLHDAYWESLDDLQEATERVLAASGWTPSEWLQAAEEGW